MLKINLLPPSIHQRKQMRLAIVAVCVFLAVEIAGMVVAREPKQTRHRALSATLNEKEGLLTTLQGVGSKSGTVLAKEGELAPKFNFFDGLMKFNKAVPEIYEQTAAYTWGEIMFLDLEANGTDLKFDAYVSKPADVAQMMLYLNNSGLFTGTPVVSGVPGWSPADEAARKAEEANANIPGSDVINGRIAGAPGSDIVGGGGIPGGGGIGGGGGGGNGPGGGGGGGNGPGGGPAGGFSGGPMMSGGGGGNGPGGGPGGGPMASGPSGISSGAGPSGMGSGGNSQGGDLGSLRLDGATRRPRGFKITVSCQLKKTVPKPTYGTSEELLGGESGGGGGGGAPGFGGGGGGNGPGGGPAGGPSGGFGGGNGPR